MDYKFKHITVKLMDDVTNYQYKNITSMHKDDTFYHINHETGTASFNIKNILFISAVK